MVSQHAIETEIQGLFYADKFDAPLAVLKPNSIVCGRRKTVLANRRDRQADFFGGKATKLYLSIRTPSP